MGHGGWLADVVVGHVAVAQSVFDKASTFLLPRVAPGVNCSSVYTYLCLVRNHEKSPILSTSMVVACGVF